MAQFECKMGRAGGGSVTFIIYVYASSINDARQSAQAQNPGYVVQAIKQVSS